MLLALQFCAVISSKFTFTKLLEQAEISCTAAPIELFLLTA
jgi:hypothetical protein